MCERSLRDVELWCWCNLVFGFFFVLVFVGVSEEGGGMELG